RGAGMAAGGEHRHADDLASDRPKDPDRGNTPDVLCPRGSGRISEMTRPFRPTAFQPFHVPGHAAPIGQTPLECADLLHRMHLCTLKEERLTLADDAPVSIRLEDARTLLHAHGHIGPPRRETMPVRVSQYGPQIG